MGGFKITNRRGRGESQRTFYKYFEMRWFYSAYLCVLCGFAFFELKSKYQLHLYIRRYKGRIFYRYMLKAIFFVQP